MLAYHSGHNGSLELRRNGSLEVRLQPKKMYTLVACLQSSHAPAVSYSRSCKDSERRTISAVLESCLKNTVPLFFFFFIFVFVKTLPRDCFGRPAESLLTAAFTSTFERSKNIRIHRVTVKISALAFTSQGRCHKTKCQVDALSRLNSRILTATISLEGVICIAKGSIIGSSWCT